MTTNCTMLVSVVEPRGLFPINHVNIRPWLWQSFVNYEVPGSNHAHVCRFESGCVPFLILFFFVMLLCVLYCVVISMMLSLCYCHCLLYDASACALFTVLTTLPGLFHTCMLFDLSPVVLTWYGTCKSSVLLISYCDEWASILFMWIALE